MTEKEMDNILRKPVASDASHNKALSDRLFSGSMELNADDLEMVTGGLFVDRAYFEQCQDFPFGEGD